MRRALRTGITGQDGSYLAGPLRATGCEVHGVTRRSSAFNTRRIEHLYHNPHVKNISLFLPHGELSDGSSGRLGRSRNSGPHARSGNGSGAGGASRVDGGK